MKKTIVAVAISLATAAVAITGQVRHPKNPLTVGPQTIAIDQPTPVCPPICSPPPQAR
ncbi:MAG TPA: hypothetical protein VKU01_35060 [Bryobacteraceae bacterium]|nr:hypothetical protein [Bryobacteraceae bacterium]